MPSPDEHAQPGSWRDGLTPKQARFISEYLVDLNATQAATRAGYSKKTAYSIGHELLKKPEIAAAIDKALAQDPGVTRTRIVDELARIAFSNPSSVAKWDNGTVTLKSSDDLTEEVLATIAEVSQTKDGVRVKFVDKLAALDRLGRATRLFADKLEVTGKDGEPLVPEQNYSNRDLARAIWDIFRTLSLEEQPQQNDETDEMEPAGSSPSPAAPTTRARAQTGCASASTGAASEPDDRPGNPTPRLSPKRKTITPKGKSRKAT